MWLLLAVAEVIAVLALITVCAVVLIAVASVLIGLPSMAVYGISEGVKKLLRRPNFRHAASLNAPV